MPDTVPITEATLRAAMRDPRYWQAGHPERGACSAWVTRGFQALHGEEAPSGGVVHVRACMRNGHLVSEHTRGNPAGSEGTGRGAELAAGGI